MKIESADIQGTPGYRVLEGDREFGTIETYQNPFHGGHCYLKFHCRQYPDAGPLFTQLRQEIGKPLQVMVPSTETALVDFLKAGGFCRARRCFETEVSQKDLVAKGQLRRPVSLCLKGDGQYAACCQLLYTVYQRNHEAINPLTADFAAFCEVLPETAFFHAENEQVTQFAFTEDNEIAYVGSSDGGCFPDFILDVLNALFEQYETIFFECDDGDESAMAMRGLFHTEDSESFDTYLYP